MNEHEDVTDLAMNLPGATDDGLVHCKTVGTAV